MNQTDVDISEFEKWQNTDEQDPYPHIQLALELSKTNRIVPRTDQQ